jgi:hypothetical protein
MDRQMSVPHRHTECARERALVYLFSHWFVFQLQCTTAAMRIELKARKNVLNKNLENVPCLLMAKNATELGHTGCHPGLT